MGSLIAFSSIASPLFIAYYIGPRMQQAARDADVASEPANDESGEENIEEVQSEHVDLDDLANGRDTRQPY